MAEDGEASGAVRLFVERAQAIRPDFSLTDETLPEIRANPLFTGELVPPPPFPVSEAFASVEGGPDVDPAGGGGSRRGHRRW